MQAATEPQRRQYSPLGVIFIRNRSPKEDQEALRHDGLECTPVAAHFWDSQIEKCMQEVVLTCGSVPFMHRYTDESATQHGNPFALHGVYAGGKTPRFRRRKRGGTGTNPEPVWAVLARAQRREGRNLHLLDRGMRSSLAMVDNISSETIALAPQRDNTLRVPFAIPDGLTCCHDAAGDHR